MKKTLLGMGALALLGAVVLPAASFGATYAYVNMSGEVMTTESTDPTTAMASAPGIAARSGVMLIEVSSDEDFVGDSVPGV